MCLVDEYTDYHENRQNGTDGNNGRVIYDVLYIVHLGFYFREFFAYFCGEVYNGQNKDSDGKNIVCVSTDHTNNAGNSGSDHEGVDVFGVDILVVCLPFWILLVRDIGGNIRKNGAVYMDDCQ